MNYRNEESPHNLLILLTFKTRNAYTIIHHEEDFVVDRVHVKRNLGNFKFHPKESII